MKRFGRMITGELCAKAFIRVSCVAVILMAGPVVARDISAYRVNGFISDYHRYQTGDVAPDIYFTPPYRIEKWNIRHLPAPVAGTHWSYMYGTYVLLNERSHKIIQAYNSDIFYKALP